MQTAVFYGASDDLVEVEGIKGGDEFGAYGQEDVFNAVFSLVVDAKELNTPEYGKVIRPEQPRLHVYASYSPKITSNGCWVFGVGKVDEDQPFPDWPIRIVDRKEHGTAHSVQLEIDCPDDVSVVRVDKD